MSLPLVCIPGLLCDEALWVPQRDRFIGERPVVIADVTQSDSIAAMAQDLLAMAPARFVLAGLSLGGYVALEVMRQAPEQVAALALIDTSARPDTAEQVERRQGLIRLATKGRFKGVTPRLMPLLIHPDRLMDTTLTGIVMAMAERVGQAAFLRQQRAILARVDSRPHLARITCPTAVVCGADDALTPPELSREMATLIPGASLDLLTGCGHLATLEAPDAINMVLAGLIARITSAS
jgi:pimeloyl-ACP methyl ester carboxylesterase